MKSRKNGGKSIEEIGRWIYKPEYGRFKDQKGNEFFLEKRLNKLLRLLVERKETIIKRSDLIELVWKDVQVNEESLTKGVFDLRKVLKKQGVTEIEISTIRNIGYQLHIIEVIEGQSKESRLLKLVLKTAIYCLVLISFAIVIIRAIRYEN